MDSIALIFFIHWLWSGDPVKHMVDQGQHFK